MLGDSITTDHISPAGSIKKDSPAGQVPHGAGRPACRLQLTTGRGAATTKVMMRGTFANIRLRNLLAPGTEGGYTTYQPARRRDDDLRRGHEVQQAGVPLIILAGKSADRDPHETGRRRARGCWVSPWSLPRASSGSTAATWSTWACCRCSSRAARRRRRSGSPASEQFDDHWDRDRTSAGRARAGPGPVAIASSNSRPCPESTRLKSIVALPPRRHPALRAA